jgi:hypothetical protein
VAEACEPFKKLLHQEVLSGPLINVDETTVKVLKEPRAKLNLPEPATRLGSGFEDIKFVFRAKFSRSSRGRLARADLVNVQTNGGWLN